MPKTKTKKEDDNKKQKQLEKRTKELIEIYMKEGALEKVDETQIKALRFNLHTVLSYQANDTILTLADGKTYAQKYFTDKYKNIFCFVCPKKIQIIKDGKPETTLSGEPKYKVIIPGKSNNSESKSRQLPYHGLTFVSSVDGGLYNVPKMSLLTDPIQLRLDQEFIPQWRPQYELKYSYTDEEQYEFVKYLADRPEYKSSNSKYGRKGCGDAKILSSMSYETFKELKRQLQKNRQVSVHIIKLINKQQDESQPDLTQEELDRLRDLKDLEGGATSRIQEEFKFKSRTIISDLRVWLTLLSNGKTNYYTFNQLQEGTRVVPEELMHLLIPKLSPNSSVKDVWLKCRK